MTCAKCKLIYTKWILGQDSLVGFRRITDTVDICCLNSKLVFLARCEVLNLAISAATQVWYFLPEG